MDLFRRFLKGVRGLTEPPLPQPAIPEKTIPHVPQSRSMPDVDFQAELQQNWDAAQTMLSSRTIVLNGDLIPDITDRLIGHLLLLERLSPAPITLLIETQGGQAYAGLAVYDVLRHLTVPLITVAGSLCAGNGLLLLLAGHKRYALKNSDIVYTVLRGGAEGQPSDIVIQANEIRRLQTIHDEIFQSRTELKNPGSAAAATPLWDLTAQRQFSPDEALFYGLIDAVVDRFEDIDAGAS